MRGLVVVSLLVAAGFSPAAQAQAPGSGSAEAGVSDWREVSVNGMHSCGIRTSGRLYCWGSDSEGQLGNGGAPLVVLDLPAHGFSEGLSHRRTARDPEVVEVVADFVGRS